LAWNFEQINGTGENGSPDKQEENTNDNGEKMPTAEEGDPNENVEANEENPASVVIDPEIGIAEAMIESGHHFECTKFFLIIFERNF
jgi:hypothetical protein